MENRCYYFYVRTGTYDNTGREYRHWGWTKRFSSKKAVHKALTVGRRTVRESEVYSAEQFIKKYGNSRSFKDMVKEAVNFSGKTGS